MNTENLKPFFKGDLPIVIDAMAKRYGKTPYEILKESLDVFNFNLAIFYKGMEEERKRQEEAMKKANTKAGYKPTIKDGKLSFAGFNIKRNIKKKGDK